LTDVLNVNYLKSKSINDTEQVKTVFIIFPIFKYVQNACSIWSSALYATVRL